jgi:hypothetical protein
VPCHHALNNIFVPDSVGLVVEQRQQCSQLLLRIAMRVDPNRVARPSISGAVSDCTGQTLPSVSRN